jgi:hypothetical protein
LFLFDKTKGNGQNIILYKSVKSVGEKQKAMNKTQMANGKWQMAKIQTPILCKSVKSVGKNQKAMSKMQRAKKCALEPLWQNNLCKSIISVG